MLPASVELHCSDDVDMSLSGTVARALCSSSTQRGVSRRQCSTVMARQTVVMLSTV